ncbi:MAG: zf-HC2 domain-containing protein [Gemmatimonadetes bacterium]|nr:zf-HC2 domain-containing protein [Gemmatimonadota bacterium]
MDPLDTVVAGLSCREVLHRLNDFLDGDLSPSDVGR